jgi:hypothetical protein
MKKLSNKYLLLAILLLPFTASAANVEVMLVDRLDGDLNHYCIDILGGKLNANPANGLQTHTCYSYEGALGVDQAMDSAGISRGEFKVVGFNVCATLTSTAAGSKVGLASCDQSDKQHFTLTQAGNIVPKTASGMCLTAGKETVLGNNGKSKHQIKTLTLEACSKDLMAYQQWTTRESLSAAHAQ